MDALTLTLSLALVAGAFGLILYPLWQQTHPEAALPPDRSGQTLEEYQARYQAALDAIKDLMFDREMGKISAEDYEKSLAKSKLEAAEIRHQIDRLNHSTAADKEAALDVEIERLVAQLQMGQLDGSKVLLDEVDAEIEALKNIRLDSTGVEEAACPQCGRAFLPGDAFCTGCGQALPEVVPEIVEEACPACGYAYQPGDIFCARCGQALNEGPRMQPHEKVVTG
ncbi:MAG: zinc ribbon domain-containing protein [Anaerolineae bacterium]|nr:zinc ribbon domain-containing protein [Anaerolineae bacterium]